MALTKIPSELSSTTGIVDNSNATAITIDSNENVGIGVVPETDWHSNYNALQVNTGGSLASYASGTVFGTALSTNQRTTGNTFVGGNKYIESATAQLYLQDNSGNHIWYNAASGTADATISWNERMRIDASGNLLVGTTSTDPAASSTETGVTLKGGGFVSISRNDSAASVNINKIGYDGSLVDFRKNGSTVGSIGTSGGDLTIGTGDTGLAFLDNQDFISPWNITTNSGRDNAVDIGHGFIRFQDIYATNGTIQTSDRNEKQDIAELSDAEQRAAVACKGLLRKFRWKDAVSKKGDDARIHFGIIAQDLQAAFEAEGLDASRYAMWCSDTWWEQDVEVPAVEAVDAVYETQTDEEGNETQVLVQEAVEAVDAYTRTDTFETAEEAPEGATEKTRLGVRYSELLAFIISAI